MSTEEDDDLDSKIIFYGEEIILNSRSSHRAITDDLSSLPKGILRAIKNLYLKNIEVETTINRVNSEKMSFISEDVTKEASINEAGIISFEELLNKEFPEIPWDVEGLFESGTINMISAPPNHYKSWVVQHVAICLAQGKDVFGRFKTKTQKVLIVNEEDNLRMIKDRSLKMVEEVQQLDIHFMVGSGFKIDEDTVLDILSESQKRGVTFVVFDSLRSIHTANENDSGEMQEILDCLKKLTKEGITVLFTHHNRKKPFGKNRDESGEESRGSTAINAAVHGHISCEEIIRDDGKFLLISQKKLKCDEKMKPFLVKINLDKENDRIHFNYSGVYDAKEDTLRKNKEITLKIVEHSDQWMSKREIALATGISESTQSKVLQELEKEKLVLSKTKRDLEKEGIKINESDTKHNAKFYSRKNEIYPSEFVEEEPEDGF